MLSFDFYVVAAATPLTSEQYRDYQLQEANRLREKILADSSAPTGLRGIVSDRSTFGNLYLQALGRVGLLRPEDTPPTADHTADNVNAFFIAIGGLLGGEAGDGIIREAAQDFGSAAATLGQLIEKLRTYYGHTPDAIGGGLPTFEEYDLQLPNPTSFVAFNLRAGFPKEDSGQQAQTVIFNTGNLGEFAGNSVSITVHLDSVT